MAKASLASATGPTPITFQTLDPGTGRAVDRGVPFGEIPGRCSLRLRVLPGAAGVHLAFAFDGSTVRRFEVPGAPGETVTLEVEWSGGEAVSLASPDRPVLTLPPDDRYRPLLPLPAAEPGAPLDLAILVDGTTRSYRQEPEPPRQGETESARRTRTVVDSLLGPRSTEPWRALVEQLASLAAELAGQHPTGRTAVLAFGDGKPPLATAADLTPAYLLHPHAEAGRAFRALEAEALRSQLLALPPTSGADFVDALAEGLAACARLRWRPEARKLVLLVGDSPGESVQHPAPRGANATARSRDVDLEAAGLHGLGVELATLYVEPPSELGLFNLDFQQELLRFAREQYERLASLPDWAFRSAGFEGGKAAQILASPPGPLGRGATLGEWVESAT